MLTPTTPLPDTALDPMPRRADPMGDGAVAGLETPWRRVTARLALRAIRQRTGRACAVLAALVVAAGTSQAATSPLVLDDAAHSIKVWPAVSVLFDPTLAMTLADARANAANFATPTTAAGTLGLRKEAAWLHVPLSVAAGSDGNWVLDIDYPMINRADVHLTDASGRIVQTSRLGNDTPRAQRPSNGRTHALRLAVRPGQSYELWMRVQTRGGMVLPLTIAKPAAFLQRSLDEQMLQGLLAGLGACLLLYSLGQWLSLREPLFLKYMVLTTGSLMFSVAQFGIGSQYVWPDNGWLEQHSTGLFALMASAGSFLFVEQALAAARHHRYFGPAMKMGAAALCIVALAYAADIIEVRVVSAVIATLGMMPSLVGLPGAVALARRGDTVGWYFLVGWIGYLVCTATMVALINGAVPVNALTMHSFQIGATLDMLLFLRILGLRMQVVHDAARRSLREREALLAMAQTDALTGLPNRRGLTAALGIGVAEAQPDRMLGVYMLDLDDFKQVNDLFGHEVGDALLVAVTHRLRSTLRATDIVARLGGDEFVVMASGLQTEQQAEDLGIQLTQAFVAPLVVQGQSCHVGVTVGYALAPPDSREPAILLKHADGAMYSGKQAGKRCARRAAVASAGAVPHEGDAQAANGLPNMRHANP